MNSAPRFHITPHGQPETSNTSIALTCSNCLNNAKQETPRAPFRAPNRGTRVVLLFFPCISREVPCRELPKSRRLTGQLSSGPVVYERTRKQAAFASRRSHVLRRNCWGRVKRKGRLTSSCSGVNVAAITAFTRTHPSEHNTHWRGALEPSEIPPLQDAVNETNESR